MSTLDRIPLPNPAFNARAVDDEMVFLSPAGDEIHSLDAVGAFIWRQFDGRHTLADVLGALLEEYDVAEAEARADLEAFADELAARGLISFV